MCFFEFLQMTGISKTEIPEDLYFLKRFKKITLLLIACLSLVLFYTVLTSIGFDFMETLRSKRFEILRYESFF